jgi:hypothetical protein
VTALAKTCSRTLAAVGAMGAAVVAVALAADGPATASAARPTTPELGPRVLPAVEFRMRAPRKTKPPTGVSNASLVLERGVFRPLPDVPGADATTHYRNNNRGQTVGFYADVTDGTSRLHGFLMTKDGNVRQLDVPGAKETAGYEISNRGEIVGNYVDKNDAQHGYVLRDGKVTTIDHPRAVQAPNVTGTKVQGIDDHGRLVGAYGDGDGLVHAWRFENGRFSDLEPPGGVQVAANEINGRGQIGIAAAGTTDGSTCPPQGGAS